MKQASKSELKKYFIEVHNRSIIMEARSDKQIIYKDTFRTIIRNNKIIFISDVRDIDKFYI